MVGPSRFIIISVLFVTVVMTTSCARFREDRQARAVPATPPPAAPQPVQTPEPAPAPQPKAEPEQQPSEKAQEGKASWYGAEFEGKETASGEIFDKDKKTAAHKSLPLGTKAKVTNKETGKSVEVEITDRGPNVPGRIVDLSEAAANELGMTEDGVEDVKVEPVKPGK